MHGKESGACGAAPTINPADYIECFNAATPAFSTVGPASFNDQVLAVTTADLIPELEAAIQQRMQREIAPVLRTVYSSAAWGQTAGNPVYPLPRASTIRTRDRATAIRQTTAATKACCLSVAPKAGCASDSRVLAHVRQLDERGRPIIVSDRRALSGGRAAA
jgi:hypothetical protein